MLCRRAPENCIKVTTLLEKCVNAPENRDPLTIPAQFKLQYAATSGNQIEDKDDQRHDEQKVNQAASHMEAESQ
jgi:hypothetical protein